MEAFVRIIPACENEFSMYLFTVPWKKFANRSRSSSVGHVVNNEFDTEMLCHVLFLEWC